MALKPHPAAGVKATTYSSPLSLSRFGASWGGMGVIERGGQLLVLHRNLNLALNLNLPSHLLLVEMGD